MLSTMRFSVFFWVLSVAFVSGLQIHVSPRGDDAAEGTAGSPVATLSKARDLLRRAAGREAVTVMVADGVYELPETLVLGPEDSGTEAAPVRWKAENPGKVVLSGGVTLNLRWEPWHDGIWRARCEGQTPIDMLFVNGRAMVMARYPNVEPGAKTKPFQGYAEDAASKERAAGWKNPAGGFVHTLHAGRWGGMHFLITGKDEDGGLVLEGGWQNNRPSGMHRHMRMVENVFEELDAPGEWFHDAGQGWLYLFPEEGVSPEDALVEAPRLATLLEIRGCLEKPVRHVAFEGFAFKRTVRTFMETREPLLRSDWRIARTGAVLIQGGEDVTVSDCEFDQPGGNAVFVSDYNRRVRVSRCHIHHAGASGVCFVGHPSAVRDPLYEYGETNDLALIDREPGPENPRYPADCTVEDSLIHDIGMVEKQAAGVQLSMAARIAMRDLTIYDTSRAGINIGDGCWGGHLIDACDVFDTVLETSDHGSFNSWGRDRYWVSDHRRVSGPEVEKDPRLPYLDAVEPVVIRNSRWSCAHGWGIDLDDGSSNYIIEQNLILRGGLKLREGYGRTVRGNVVINNSLHPHVWFPNCGDEVSGNLFTQAYRPIGQPQGWGKQADKNFFLDEGDLASARQVGGDGGSLVVEADFVDAESGDFRFNEGAAALAAGFVNFPMDRFGVKKPDLKKLAREPEVPPLRKAARSGGERSAEERSFWAGAWLHGLRGQEFSAFGTRPEDGGVQVAALGEDSAAARMGLLENDLIQGLNGKTVKDVAGFFAALATVPAGSCELKIVRQQQVRTIRIPGAAWLRVTDAADIGMKPGASASFEVAVNRATANDPVTILGDGELAKGYGPVFPNGVRNGIYRIDLGSPRELRSFTAWAYNVNGNRAAQDAVVYGVDPMVYGKRPEEAGPPNWNQALKLGVPLGTLSAAAPEGGGFRGVTIRPTGESFGRYRWIFVLTRPISGRVENTAFQEFVIEAD